MLIFIIYVNIQILYYINENKQKVCRWISSQLYFIKAGIQKIENVPTPNISL